MHTVVLVTMVTMGIIAFYDLGVRAFQTMNVASHVRWWRRRSRPRASPPSHTLDYLDAGATDAPTDTDTVGEDSGAGVEDAHLLASKTES